MTKTISPPQSITAIIEQLIKMSENDEINFAFAFIYPDKEGRQWFEARTAGNPRILKSLFKYDMGADIQAKIQLDEQTSANDFKKVRFSFPAVLVEDQ